MKIRQNNQPNIDKSNILKQYMFSSRLDYEKYFSYYFNENKIWEDADLVKAIQFDWHNKGQNGCIFANIISNNPSEYGWESFVFTEPINKINSKEFLQEIDQVLLDAILSERIQIFSFLFPKIDTDDELLELLKILSQSALFTFHLSYRDQEYTSLSLRVPINDNVLSWVVGFTPFQYSPFTRKAPVVELVIRVKLKPPNLFFRLNQDQKTAHLADILLGFDDGKMEAIWQNTVKRCSSFLLNENRAFASAKSTFKLPNTLINLLMN